MLEYSFQLFDILLRRDAALLPGECVVRAQELYRTLKSGVSVTQQDVDRALISFGLDAWEYWQAEAAFLDTYGREKEKEAFFSGLSPELKDKWLKYEGKLGNMEVYDHDEQFEQAFTPEEDLQLERAVIEAKAHVTAYVRTLAVFDKKEEYRALVDTFAAEKTHICELIRALRELATSLPELAIEIEEAAHSFELGFAEVEERPTVALVQGRIDFYRGKFFSEEP